jgi:hypothetical protein
MEWWGNSALLASGYDSDAQAYMTAVEAADGQALEVAVKDAINAFVVGCKADVIWTAIKACCILAGARTLAGALVPLVGPAPTNFNFTGARYNRKTGLLGDGATTYLSSNRNNIADPQNNRHVCVYATQKMSSFVNKGLIGSAGGTPASTRVLVTTADNVNFNLSDAVNFIFTNSYTVGTGLFGASRNNSSIYTARGANTNVLVNNSSGVPGSSVITVFSTGAAFLSDPRLSFYSIGESLDLALLDARITGLMNALAAAIP